MKEDFIEFKKYYLDAVNQVPENSFFHQTINHKFVHSVEVLRCGQTILNQTPELANKTKNFCDLAQKALLFHDVGRFKEAVCHYLSQQQKIDFREYFARYDHGEIGSLILADNPRYNDRRILFAIKWHGKIIEDAVASSDWQEAEKLPEFDDIKKILFLVRDADKLANLYRLKSENRLTKDLFYQQLNLRQLQSPISDIVLNKFFNRQSISFSDVYSFADRIMMVVAWIYDLNYLATKKIFKENGYGEYLLNEILKYHKNRDDTAQIASLIKAL